MDKDFDLDKIIEKLTGLRNQKPGKTVNLLESEFPLLFRIRSLCVKSQQIFQEQPVLLELDCPIKICGSALIQATSTDSSTTCLGCSSSAATRPSPTTSSWATTSTAASRVSRPSVFCWPTKSSTNSHQVPRELLPAPRQPREQRHQPHLRLLRRV